MRAVVVTSLALIILLLSGVPMFMHPPTAYSGVTLRLTGALVQPNIIKVAPNSPGYRVGLRSGDIISCVSLRDANFIFGGAYSPGTPVHLCVTHRGVRRAVQFVPDTRPPAPSIYRTDALAALRLAGYALFLLCAVILVLGRPGLMTWMFFAYALTAAPNNATGLNLSVINPTLYAIPQVLMGGASTLTQTAFLLAFTVLMPEDAPPTLWRKVGLRIAWAMIPILAAVGLLVYAQTAFTVSERIAEWASFFVTSLVVIALIGRLVTMGQAERARFGWAAFAIAWALVIDLLRLHAVIPGSLSGMFSLLQIVTPIVLLYAVLKRHVIDIRFAISRTLVYALITTILVGVIGAVDWATSAYLHEVKVAMALDALVTIAIAFALNRVHRWVERVVDVALFRQKYAAEEYLNRLGPTLLDARREETVHSELVRAPVRALDLTMAAVFRETESAFVLCASAGPDVEVPPEFDPDNEVVRFLNTGRTLVHLRSISYDAIADLAIPLFQGKRLTGFVLYGPHNDGTHLDPDEIETLKRFCDAAAQAYISITYERYNAMPQPALA